MCEEILFADVCGVLHKLSDPFVKPVEKLSYFSRYLDKIRHESPVELFSLLRLLTPSLDRRRPPSQLRQPLLARVYAQVFALPPAAAARLRLYKDPAAITPEAGASVRVGDFGSFVIATLKRRIGRRSPTITVRDLNTRLDRICLATTFPDKIAVLHELLPLLTVHEHKWFVRILMKDVKLGGLTGERLLTVLHPGARKIINQCSDLQSTLEAIEEQLKLNTEDNESPGEATRRLEHGNGAAARGSGDREQMSMEEEQEENSSRLLFCPLRPMLAQPVRPEASDIKLELFPVQGNGSTITEGIVRAKSESHVYFIERKYDGERMLAHIDLCRRRMIESELPERDEVRRNAAAEAANSLALCVRLFSRRGRDISQQYGGGLEFSYLPHNEDDTRHQATNVENNVEASPEGEQWDEEKPGENRLKPVENAVLNGLRVMLAKALRGNQAILDGELLAWDDERSTFLPFGTNKSVAVSETTSCHLSYVVFDILLYRGTEGTAYNLLSMELKDRKKLLERVLKPVGSRIMLASYVEATEANQVIDAFNVAVQKRHEGIVVKRATSLYHLHSRWRSGWYKIKPRTGCLSDTLDLIVIGAYFAETTKRREHTSTHAIDHCSHFLLGVLEGKGGLTTTRVRSFCRIGSGFSLTDLAQMRDFVRPYCRRLPPLDAMGNAGENTSIPPWLKGCRMNASTRVDVTWPPSRSFVMEVSAAEVIPSVDFDVGFTLRFATATRPFRRDKDWYEAMSETDLKVFFLRCEERGGIPISSSEAPVGSSVGPTIKSEVVSPASDGETDEDEGDDGVHNTVDDVAAEDRHIRGMLPTSICTLGDRFPENMTSNIRPSQLITGYQRLVSGDSWSIIRSGSLGSGRSGKRRLDRLSGRPWRPTRVEDSFLDLSTPPVELQGLIPHPTTDSTALNSTALRGKSVWVVEGADEEGDEVFWCGGGRREEHLTGQDVKPTKKALEWLVAALGGIVAPALSHGIDYVIASKYTFRTEAAVNAFAEGLSNTDGPKGAKGTSPRLRRSNVGKDVMTMPPVLHYSWLLDCARLNTLAPVQPIHVLHGTPALAQEFADQYDKYGDAYFKLDSSPRSLLRILETTVANGQTVGTGVPNSSNNSQQQKVSNSEPCCSLPDKRQRPVGDDGVHDLSSDDEADVQPADLRRAIAKLCDYPELSCMVLYVPPSDVVWDPPCALKMLRPSSLPYSPDSSGSSPAVSRPYCSIDTREMQKATRAALIARCCMRGMRLTFHTEEATHILASSPVRLAAQSISTSDGHLECEERNVAGMPYYVEGDIPEVIIDVDTDGLRREGGADAGEDRNLNAASNMRCRCGGSGGQQQTPTAADQTEVKLHIPVISEADLHRLAANKSMIKKLPGCSSVVFVTYNDEEGTPYHNAEKWLVTKGDPSF